MKTISQQNSIMIFVFTKCKTTHFHNIQFMLKSNCHFLQMLLINWENLLLQGRNKSDMTYYKQKFIKV